MAESIQTAGTPTIADLFGENTPPANKEVGIVSGTGEETPPNLAEQEAASTEQKDSNAETKEEETKEETKEEEQQQEEPSPLDFYDQVEKLTGEHFQIDFGNTDPLSPEGVALREKAIIEDTAHKFEEYLKTSDPRSYAYFLHREAGGSDEDFFSQKEFVLPVKDDLMHSTDMQIAMVKQDLKDKGIPDDIIDSTVDKYIKENKITEYASNIYDTRKHNQEYQLQYIEEQNKAQQEAFNKTVNSLYGAINKELAANTLRFNVPEVQKTKFLNYVKDNLRYDNGKFYVVSELGDNLKDILESQYFQFVKGDISSLVKKEANKQTVQRLRNTVNKANTSTSGSENIKDTKNNYIPLGQL